MAELTYQDVMQALRNADAAGDVSAATRLAEIAQQMAGQQAPQAEKSTLQQFAEAARPEFTRPEFLQELGRQLGLTARYGIEGASGLVDFLTAPVRGAINLAAPESMQARPVAPQIAGALNLPTPQTDVERVVGEAARSVAGAGTGMGIARLAQPVSQAGQAVRQALTAAPGAQLASAAGAGAGSSFAQELGMGETEQLLAGVAGGITPAAVPALATRAMKSVTPQTQQVISQAREAGYTLPPSQTNPTLTNKVIESLSGKVKTNQSTAQKNQEVTNNLAKKALGIPQDQPLTEQTLKTIRAGAGEAYDQIAAIGNVNTTPQFQKKLDDIVKPYLDAAKGFPNAPPNKIIDEIQSLKTDVFSAQSGISKIRELRESADTAYAAGNKALGKAYKDAAIAIEDAIETQAKSLGNQIPDDLLKNFRESRKLIAKTYSVQRALNEASGNVVATNLAAQLKRGAPLQNELKTIAQTAQSFPKSVQSVDQMAQSLPLSPLDIGAALLGYGTLGGAGTAGLIARPAARGLLLSQPYQSILGRPGGLFGSQVRTPEELLMGGLLGTQYGTNP
jgi:hypothetical protein